MNTVTIPQEILDAIKGFQRRPTKFYMSEEKRAGRRKMAKASRKSNRGLGKGQKRSH